LILLLHRLGSKFWDGEDVTFPQIIFDAIKDNDAYVQLLASAEGDAWSIRWFSEYLRTFWDLPTWGEMLAKILNVLCDEVQHERFKDVRPIIMTAAANVSSAFLSTP
jgi:senataxin